MAQQTRLLVEKQVDRVRRRLFLQVILQSVVVCWAVGLLGVTLWFLLRPFTFAGLGEGDAVRWSVPAGVLAFSTAAGLVLAWLRRPNRVMSSLALDEKFNLKERVTTVLTLSDPQLESPAGQALLRDVSAHLADLKVTAGFPLRLSRRHVFMPAGALALAVLACVLDPYLGKLNFGSRILADQPVQREIDAKKNQDERDKLKKSIAKRREEQQTKSAALKELQKEFDKLMNQPLDPKDEDKVRERINEFHKLKDKLKERMDAIKEKADQVEHMKKMLKELGLDKDKLTKDGPAKDFEDALMNGNFEKARAALEKLAKDLKNDKLTKEQQKQLAEQFKELHDQLKKLAQKDNQVMKQLEQQLKDGKIKQADFDREMARLKELKDFTDIVGDAKDALDKDGAKAAGEKLDKVADQFERLELTDQEVQDLIRDQQDIQDALDLLGDALDDGDGNDGGGRPGRRRPIDPNDPNSKIRNQKQKAEVDAKGIQRVTGYARGGNFNKIPATAAEGAFRQAGKEAPEALDRQQIPDDRADITRGYFNRLGNQK
jgi:hypothetical protein